MSYITYTIAYVLTAISLFHETWN